VYNNPGLCGDIVNVGSNLGTTYDGGISGTNLGNPCPTTAVGEPGELPCCDTLRQNPVFCCLEARRPEFALSVCQEC
jgi:hypothetical protein